MHQLTCQGAPRLGFLAHAAHALLLMWLPLRRQAGVGGLQAQALATASRAALRSRAAVNAEHVTQEHGYKLPRIVFWNLNGADRGDGRNASVPVTKRVRT